MLRKVEPAGPPLTRDELKRRGDELLGIVRALGVDAMRKSMRAEFLRKGTVTVDETKEWRDIAREARDAWAKVEAHLAELHIEIDRTAAHIARGDAS